MLGLETNPKALWCATLENSTTRARRPISDVPDVPDRPGRPALTSGMFWAPSLGIPQLFHQLAIIVVFVRAQGADLQPWGLHRM